jgi:hypothetical protein
MPGSCPWLNALKILRYKEMEEIRSVAKRSNQGCIEIGASRRKAGNPSPYDMSPVLPGVTVVTPFSG